MVLRRPSTHGKLDHDPSRNSVVTNIAPLIAVMTGAKDADAACAALRLLASPAGKAALVAAGIE